MSPGRRSRGLSTPTTQQGTLFPSRRRISLFDLRSEKTSRTQISSYLDGAESSTRTESGSELLPQSIGSYSRNRFVNSENCLKAALGHKPSFYIRFLDRLLCEVKQPLIFRPGDRLDPANSGRLLEHLLGILHVTKNAETDYGSKACIAEIED